MSVGPRQFHETLRVFVVGKNYRLQNIQLSKISLAGTAGQSVYVGHPPERRYGSAKTIGADVGAGEAREPHHFTETFQRTRLRVTLSNNL